MVGIGDFCQESESMRILFREQVHEEGVPGLFISSFASAVRGRTFGPVSMMQFEHGGVR